MSERLQYLAITVIWNSRHTNIALKIEYSPIILIKKKKNHISEYSRECSAADVDGCITTSPQEEQCFCQTDLCNRWSPLTAPADLYNKSSSMTAAIATVIINTLLFSTFK